MKLHMPMSGVWTLVFWRPRVVPETRTLRAASIRACARPLLPPALYCLGPLLVAATFASRSDHNTRWRLPVQLPYFAMYLSPDIFSPPDQTLSRSPRLVAREILMASRSVSQGSLGKRGRYAEPPCVQHHRPLSLAHRRHKNTICWTS